MHKGASMATIALTTGRTGGDYEMAWEVEFTDEFDSWWQTLTIHQQAAIEARVDQLEAENERLRAASEQRMEAMPPST